jgi:metal-responsive CopG/Arc/MetJ family transcriptional regulator
MKVAVSIPDDVFADAEDLAQRLKTSRSEVYARALREFVQRHAPDRVAELMNRVVADVGDDSDPFVARGAKRVLRRVEW